MWGTDKSVMSMSVVKYFRENQEKEIGFHLGSLQCKEKLLEVRCEYQLSYIKKEIKIKELKAE